MERKDGKITDRQDRELEFTDLDEDSFEDSGQWEEDRSDEPEPMKPWVMALVLGGLVVLAAVICAVLWHFTHMDQNPDSGDNGVTAEITRTAEPEDVSASQDTGTEETSEEGQQDGGDTVTEDTIGTGEPAEPSEVPAEPSGEPEDAAGSAQETGSAPEADGISGPEQPEDGDAGMKFDAVQESVTPKDVVNLRSVPSTSDENTVVVQASNGEVLSRTGINAATGWSRIDYNGQTLFAVTQYLTTDLDYKTPVQPSDPNRVSTASGRVIIFVDCDDQMTPKEYVNLRTEPSTTEGDATVRCQVSNGESVHRTGYSADSGWSRVEYNGEVLYVVTSLMLAQ